MDLEKIYKLLRTTNREEVLIALNIIKAQNIPLEGKLKEILWREIPEEYILEMLESDYSQVSDSGTTKDFQKYWILKWIE